MTIDVALGLRVPLLASFVRLFYFMQTGGLYLRFLLVAEARLRLHEVDKKIAFGEELPR